MRGMDRLRRWVAPLLEVEGAPRALLPEELRQRGWDRWLAAATLGLSAAGLVMVYSATSVTSSGTYLQSQGIRVLLGIGAFAFAHRIDYHKWGRWAPRLFLGGLALLLLVWVPGVGHAAGGARRWISLAGVTIQPSELARLGLIVYLAYLLSKPRARLERFSTGILPCLIALGFVGGLVFIQPHLSATLALIAITGLMMVAGRVPWRHLGLVVAGAAAMVPPLVMFGVVRPYQIERPLTWVRYLLTGEGKLGESYQMDQSILAIGSGGWVGRGLGESRQKWSFLPEAHNDFIFSIVGEELGLAGAVVLIVLMVMLLWRAYDAARRAPDRFGSLLATGLGAAVAVYAGINMLVATGMFPSTGLPLPLVSYGGTAVIVTLFSLGILGNISSQGDSSFLVGIGDQE